ncbi:hypothetical protein EDD15DRAFT_2203640 [Pisolithus albus]|nr:hypothetical protein EDD15DRAFT_2203640 [Pisolithus albus]
MSFVKLFTSNVGFSAAKLVKYDPQPTIHSHERGCCSVTAHMLSSGEGRYHNIVHGEVIALTTSHPIFILQVSQENRDAYRKKHQTALEICTSKSREGSLGTGYTKNLLNLSLGHSRQGVHLGHHEVKDDIVKRRGVLMAQLNLA